MPYQCLWFEVQLYPIPTTEYYPIAWQAGLGSNQHLNQLDLRKQNTQYLTEYNDQQRFARLGSIPFIKLSWLDWVEYKENWHYCTGLSSRTNNEHMSIIHVIVSLLRIKYIKSRPRSARNTEHKVGLSTITKAEITRLYWAKILHWIDNILVL